MSKRNKKSSENETDGEFLLKIVMYVLLASFWIKFSEPIDAGVIPLGGIPVGLLIGLLIASHERFQIDRKIEYVVLIVITIVTYFLPAGIVI